MPRNNFYTITFFFQKICKIRRSSWKVSFILNRNREKAIMNLTYIPSTALKLNHVRSSEEATELTTFDRLPHVGSAELTYTC